MMIIARRDIDSVFGIEGLSEDPFFGKGATVIHEGMVNEIVYACGDDISFKELEFTEGRMRLAMNNMRFFADRATPASATKPTMNINEFMEELSMKFPGLRDERYESSEDIGDYVRDQFNKWRLGSSEPDSTIIGISFNADPRGKG